jgi:hypothetical protein
MNLSVRLAAAVDAWLDCACGSLPGRSATLLGATTQLYDAAVSWAESSPPSLPSPLSSKVLAGAYIESSLIRQLYGLVDESAKLLELAGRC